MLEGELTFRLEDREHRASAGTWAFVPPEVVHTFSVTGDSRAHFLDIHTPSCGFGDFVRGLMPPEVDERRNARAAFDQLPAPEYASGDPGLVVLRQTGGTGGVGSTEPPKRRRRLCRRRSGKGETITDRPERRATLLVEADELTVTEFHYGPGERGAPPHVHHHHADAFLVVEGELTFASRDGPFRSPAGTLVVFPPNVVHGFDNDGAETRASSTCTCRRAASATTCAGASPTSTSTILRKDGGADPASIVTARLSV